MGDESYGGGDYLLALKDNHPTLHEQVHEYFLKLHAEPLPSDVSTLETIEPPARGRREERYYTAAPLPAGLHGQDNWAGLQSLVQTTTTIVQADKTTIDSRYFLSSLAPSEIAKIEGRVLYFDEIGEVGEDVQKILYPLLDHRRELIINAKEGVKIKAHPDFWFVGSYNPPARLPAHFRQRCRYVPVDYLPADEEKALLVERVGVAEDDADFLVRVAEITRTRLQ